MRLASSGRPERQRPDPPLDHADEEGAGLFDPAHCRAHDEARPGALLGGRLSEYVRSLWYLGVFEAGSWSRWV